MRNRLPRGSAADRYARPIAGVLLCRVLLRGWQSGRPYGCAGLVVRGADGMLSVHALLTPFDAHLLRDDSWWVFRVWYPAPGGTRWREQTYGRPADPPTELGAPGG